jgi:hypothetical protein
MTHSSLQLLLLGNLLATCLQARRILYRYLMITWLTWGKVSFQWIGPPKFTLSCFCLDKERLAYSNICSYLYVFLYMRHILRYGYHLYIFLYMRHILRYGYHLYIFLYMRHILRYGYHLHPRL